MTRRTILRSLFFSLNPLVAILWFGLLAGCGRHSAIGPGAELVIGEVLPMSGETADWGRAASRGAELAVRRLATDGVPLKLLPPEDNHGDARESADAVRRLVGVHGAVVIIGPITSGNTAAAARVADELRVPLITPSATAAAVTRDSAYAFRACYVDDFQGRILATFAATDLKAKRVGIVVDPGDAYSSGLADVFERTFRALGGSTERVTISVADREFGPQILMLRDRLKPDTLFVPANYPTVAAFLRQARRQGVSQPVLTGDAAHSPELLALAGDSAREVYVTSHFTPDSTEPRVSDFVRDYKAAFGEEPNVAAALTYDAVMMAGRAFQTKKPAESIRDAIARTRNLPGVTGMITLDADRNPVKGVVVLKADGRVFKFVRTVD